MGDIVQLRARRQRVTPHDFVGILFADTRRAKRWQRAFRKAGLESRVVETIGEESETGACKVSVLRRDLPAANQLVTAVTRGEVTLPGAGFSMTTLVAIIVVAAMVAALVRGAL